MAQISRGLRAVLSAPWVYRLFQNLMGARSGWRRFMDRDVRASAGDCVLDIGCGPGDALEFLPAVRYWGFDISAPYIDYAQRRHGARGQFRAKLLEDTDLAALPRFDIVIASGLLHHLNDDEARQLMHLAHAALRPGGRLITLDPCFVPGQPRLARFLIERDRGRNVRDQANYVALATGVFDTITSRVEHKVWIPYTHCFMECTRGSSAP